MNDNSEMVSFTELATMLAMDKSHATRYVKRVASKLGVDIKRWRDPRAGNQQCSAVTKEGAELIVGHRCNEGFLGSQRTTNPDEGVFYVIQLVPELKPGRIKLGFGTDIVSRLYQHRTAAPTAVLVKTWPCKRTWELAAIDCLTSSGCKLVLNEVYECGDISGLVKRGDDLFAVLPSPSNRVALSDISPLKTGQKGDSEPNPT